MSMFHMSNDSGLFHTEPAEDRLPLYEAKMIYLYDHRYGSYEGVKSHSNSGIQLKRTTIEQYNDFNYSVRPWYWVDKYEVEKKLEGKWDKKWFIGFRRIANVMSDRTSIFSILPYSASGDSVFYLLINNNIISMTPFVIANLKCLIFDYITRQKIGGNNMNFFYVKQLPVLPPDWYTEDDIAFIKLRVLELVYTAYDLKPFAEDMGYDGEPFKWDEERRHILKSELDAYYAKLYGLTRDELRYILDPADVYGEDFPGETFRVLKEKEIKKYGEYKTRRLVLEAWDRLFGKD